MEAVTESLAQFAATLDLREVPEVVVEKVKLHIADTVGVMLAGSRQEPSRIALRALTSSGTGGDATAVGHGTRLPCTSSALVNGTSAHSLELDDGGCGIHPGAVVVPAALALAQRSRSSGAEFIAAVVVGYEVALRISHAAFPWVRRRGFHPTAVCGSFGAAAAAGRILGLEAGRMLSAIGLAGTQTSGMREGSGSDAVMMKRLHPGIAAQNGVLAALLAAEGYQAPPTILEGRNGFFNLFAQEYNLPSLLEGLGSKYLLARCYMKPYSCCRHFHAPIDSLLGLVQESQLKLESVQRMVVVMYKEGSNFVQKRPASFGEAQFSLPFCLAVALQDGQLLPSNLHAHLNDERILSLADHVDVAFDADLDREYVESQKRAHVLQVVLQNGETLTRRTDYPRGSANNPMSLAEVRGKFLGLAREAVHTQAASRLLEDLCRLEELENVDALGELLS